MDQKLLKEFPFLEGLERVHGELGVIRVKNVSTKEIYKIREMCNKDDLKIFDQGRITEGSDTGAIVCIHTVDGDELIPTFTQTIVYKYNFMEARYMENKNILSGILTMLLMESDCKQSGDKSNGYWWEFVNTSIEEEESSLDIRLKNVHKLDRDTSVLAVKFYDAENNLYSAAYTDTQSQAEVYVGSTKEFLNACADYTQAW